MFLWQDLNCFWTFKAFECNGCTLCQNIWSKSEQAACLTKTSLHASNSCFIFKDICACCLAAMQDLLEFTPNPQERCGWVDVATHIAPTPHPPCSSCVVRLPAAIGTRSDPGPANFYRHPPSSMMAGHLAPDRFALHRIPQNTSQCTLYGHHNFGREQPAILRIVDGTSQILA